MPIFNATRIEKVLLSLLSSFHNAYLYRQVSHYFWVFISITLLFCQPCRRSTSLLNASSNGFGMPQDPPTISFYGESNISQIWCRGPFSDAYAIVQPSKTWYDCNSITQSSIRNISYL